MKTKIFFLTAVTSSFLFAELHRSNSIVTDLETNLMWEDQVLIAKKSWNEAISYCENLTFGGYLDWRLPNVIELLSIIDQDRSKPSIDPIFRNTKTSYYWSSTVNYSDPESPYYESDTAKSWSVAFDDGYNYANPQTTAYYVRCVR